MDVPPEPGGVTAEKIRANDTLERFQDHHVPQSASKVAISVDDVRIAAIIRKKYFS